MTSVEYLEGKRLCDDKWARTLAESALSAEFGQPPKSLLCVQGESRVTSRAWRIQYIDGLRAMVMAIGRNDLRWNFACRLKRERRPRATQFYVGPWCNRNLFKALCHAIQHHFRTGRSPYPVERTLLTTGLTEVFMHASSQPGQRLSTPHIEFSYKARDFKAMREMGATWDIITDDIPEPHRIDTFCG